MNFTAIFSIFSVFIAAPALVFLFVYQVKRGKTQVESLRLQKEMLELELRKEELRLRVLVEENKKYDRLIDKRFEAIT